MRTTLDLDDWLVEALIERNPGVSKTVAIERAIRNYLESDAISQLISLAGNFEIEDVSGDLRAADRHT